MALDAWSIPAFKPFGHFRLNLPPLRALTIIQYLITFHKVPYCTVSPNFSLVFAHRWGKGFAWFGFFLLMCNEYIWTKISIEFNRLGFFWLIGYFVLFKVQLVKCLRCTKCIPWASVSRMMQVYLFPSNKYGQIWILGKALWNSQPQDRRVMVLK